MSSVVQPCDMAIPTLHVYTRILPGLRQVALSDSAGNAVAKCFEGISSFTNVGHSPKRLDISTIVFNGGRISVLESDH